jgi:hypothetical protein
MSENKRSFWASVPGLVTGIAGLLTGVVGLVTVLIQLNVIGGDKVGGNKASDTPAVSATTVAPSGTTPKAAEVGSFTVSPKPLTFGPTDPKVKTVTVKNTSDTAWLTLQSPRITGDNAAQFSAAFDTCSGAPLQPGLSCTLKVTFTPAGPLGNYKATLQIPAPAGAVRADEVPLTASTLLGG